jgi:hypothetical protein
MSQRRFCIAVAAAAIGLAGAAAPAAEEPSFGKDLMATIALQGLPCDQVIESHRNADSDYDATCKDGHRYHVYVNAQGRVVVEKR